MQIPDQATDQHGAFTRCQAEGIERRGRHALHHATRRGDVVRLFPRVFARAIDAREADCRMAAALESAGANAYLTGTSALLVHGCRLSPDIDPSVIHLAMVSGQVRARDDPKVHRYRRLGNRDLMGRRGLRVVSLEWAILEECARIGEQAATIVGHALQTNRTTVKRLRDCAIRAGRTPGAATMRLLVTDMAPPTNWFELHMRRRLERSGLPVPEYGMELETPDGVRYPDGLWRTARVALESDGKACHFFLADWEAGLERDDALAAIGYEAIHITYRQWRRDPGRCLLRIERVLRARWPADAPWPYPDAC